MANGTSETTKRLALFALLAALAVTLYLVKVRKGMADFEVYHRAAARVVSAENLYRPEDGHYQFKYFPVFALATAPLAWLDRPAAKACWYTFSFALLCVFVRGAVRRVPDPRLSRRALVWLAVLFAGKFYARELFLGQTNLLFAMALLGMLSAAASGSKAIAGVCAAVAVFVKPYGLILVPWLALATGGAGLVAFALVVGAGLLLPAILYGWTGNIDQLLEWYRTVTQTSEPNLLKEENISFATAWAKWIGAGPLAGYLAVATGLAAISAAGWVLARRRTVRNASFLDIGLLMMLVPVLSPQGWDYLLLLATPAILCIVDRWGDTPRAWRVVAGTGLALMSFTIFDLMGRALYAVAMQLSVVSIAVMLLIACTARLRYKGLA